MDADGGPLKFSGTLPDWLAVVFIRVRQPEPESGGVASRLSWRSERSEPAKTKSSGTFFVNQMEHATKYRQGPSGAPIFFCHASFRTRDARMETHTPFGV